LVGGEKATAREVNEYTYTPPSHTTSPQDPEVSSVEVSAGTEVPSRDVRPPVGSTVMFSTPTAVEARKVGLADLALDTLTAVTIRVMKSSQVPA
jgi:hypothetical protein